jgi:hypothetical protein
MSSRIQLQFRRDAYASLEGITLAVGEPAYATDTHNFYIGDGVNPVSGLTLLGGGAGTAGTTGATGINEIYGTWDVGNAYLARDVVISSVEPFDTYIAKNDVSGGTDPSLNTTDWALLVKAGPTGGFTFSGETYSVLWSPDGVSVTGTTGFQYNTGVGLTLDVLNIQTYDSGGRIAIGKLANAGTNSVTIGSFTEQIGQGTGSVAIGQDTGAFGQGNTAVAIGFNTGQTGQEEGSVALGSYAGQTEQKTFAVAVGTNAGQTVQATEGVAVGYNAGQTGQGEGSVALGSYAGQTSQKTNALALGSHAGQESQGGETGYSVALGYNAGQYYQGSYSVALGAKAGATGQANNTIILNASGEDTNGVADQTGSFYVNPVRTVVVDAGSEIATLLVSGNTYYQVFYSPTTYEFIYVTQTGAV